MKIVKSMIKETSTIIKAAELFDRFLSYYQGKIIQISGPFITPTEGRSSLPDYIVSGSVVIEDEEKTTTIGDKLITGVNTTGVKLNG